MAEILIHQTISQQPRLESLTMTVPGECVGRIIGRQGDTIRYSMKQDKVTPRKYVCKIIGHIIVDVCIQIYLHYVSFIMYSLELQ